MTPTPSPGPHHLGQAIREFRHRLGISQNELAERAGIDRSHASAIERGEYDARYRVLHQLATALGVRPSAIVARAEELAEEDGA